ncbi:hypothetical protein CHGG_10696 [Chaetomium globosum CBS 148.51]|uniref:F-box domain-containing protein n=1 Tax=Chaetomium globosum (strain ATCC 6205 / CBS 148.51 / DSM 1962 / NBRC 6347 / NRRL 1970) TaxID=306901 RepID=Q2GMV8_CHAGB|nr:uncharacterized protein CHGG_10696 [Chaetomium globosum CBS 148.51]EAQ84292.1 hypothetical protein CHGG_10696 [Chaetomium globosum CBS 148.51]
MPTKRSATSQDEDDDLEPVEDLTQPLALHSKRTERRRRKQEKRATSASSAANQLRGFLDLPLELMMAILDLLRPSDIFVLSRVNHELRNFLLANEMIITRRIIDFRYPVLERCLIPPVLMENIDPAIQLLLKSPDRPDLALSHRTSPHNIPSPDNTLHCTCLTCMVRWNALCAAVDFAHWQDHLDKGIPIPTVPRGTVPPWNGELLARNRRVVLKALTSSLWYARILQAHLDSTTRSIRRHSHNKADQRPHFYMTDTDMRASTDAFLQREGPPTFDYPYSRELYYMLEAFLPGRSWIAASQKWVYIKQTQEWHEMDLGMLANMDQLRRQVRQDPVVQSSVQPSDGQEARTRSIWEKYDVPKCPVVEVTELWVEEDDRESTAVLETKTVNSLDVDSWFEEPPRRYFPGGAYTRAVRLVWVGEERKNGRASPSTGTLEKLSEEWGLQDALDYARGCFAGVSAVEPDDDKQIFTVAYHPKLIGAWLHTEANSLDSTPQTHAIIFAEGEERVELFRILDSKWAASSVKHPMFPALLCSLVLAHGLDSTLEDIKAAVREVEARTGHHRFASRRQTQPAAGELGSLSAQMSGCAAKLANGTRKMKVVEAVNDFISQHNRRRPPDAQEQGASSLTHPRNGFSASHLGLLRHRVQMQAVDAAYVQQRVQIQIAALFHLIAQQDNAIAFDTASATRSIAASSQQDSSSMKMLALVAMFFLPGSFVAALFSAPLFAWDEALTAGGMAVGTRPQFALFWAVTAPLTALIFVLYGLWMCVQSRKERNKNGSTFV